MYSDKVEIIVADNDRALIMKKLKKSSDLITKMTILITSEKEGLAFSLLRH